MKKRILVAILILLLSLPLLTLGGMLYLMNTLKIPLDTPTRALEQNEYTILLLGIGGQTHEGPLLTDSITLAHIDFQKNAIRLLSLPRDLWSESMQDKINTAYTYASEQYDDPFTYTQERIKEIVGVHPDYTIVLDFDIFTQMIDLLDGIDIHVREPFTDNAYPIDGRENTDCVPFDPEYKCRYEVFHVDAGMQHFDGAQALKFVRSRHSTDAQGTDFARAQRQQQVILGAQDKLLKTIREVEYRKLLALYRLLHSRINRNIPDHVVYVIAREVIKRGMYRHVNTIPFPEDMLTVPNSKDYNDRYVLVPIDQTSFSDNITRLLLGK